MVFNKKHPARDSTMYQYCGLDMNLEVFDHSSMYSYLILSQDCGPGDEMCQDNPRFLTAAEATVCLIHFLFKYLCRGQNDFLIC